VNTSRVATVECVGRREKRRCRGLWLGGKNVAAIKQ
jgi:hypothetical protein